MYLRIDADNGSRKCTYSLGLVGIFRELCYIMHQTPERRVRLPIPLFAIHDGGPHPIQSIDSLRGLGQGSISK